MMRALHGFLLVASAVPIVISLPLALVLFALAGGPMALGALGFGAGALLARWSRIGLQIAGLLVAAGLQSWAYYASAYNAPTSQLIGESVALAVYSIPFGFAFGAGGRWFGDHVLYAQVDAIWPARGQRRAANSA